MRVYLVAQIPVEHPHNFAWVILLLLAFTEKSVAKKPLRKANAASQATTVKLSGLRTFCFRKIVQAGMWEHSPIHGEPFAPENFFPVLRVCVSRIYLFDWYRF